MINMITVTNHVGESVKLELRYPEKSGLLVQDISGLGPSKANINSTELATTDGSLYNSARLNSRNIVFTLKLLASPTVEDSRQKSYKYFPIKKRVHLKIETDNRTCETYGYVESNEPIIFSNQQTTQISIICPDPFLYSTGDDGDTITVLSGIDSAFIFPFSNESLSDDIISFGEIITSHEQILQYKGDADVGVVITIRALGPATNITIYNDETNESMKINTDRLSALTGFGIINGDEITISTLKGNKFIMLLRDGIYTNILNCLDKDADWFQIVKGDNIFAYVAETGGTNLHVSIQNQTVYEGV